MGQTRMFRDRVVSMEQTLEGGEKHLPLLKALCAEALPDFVFKEHSLDHERDMFVMDYDAPDGKRQRVSWTRMVLFDAERIPTLSADPAAALRAKIVEHIRAQVGRPEILVTFRHLEEGWVDTPEPRRDSSRRRRRGGRAARRLRNGAARNGGRAAVAASRSAIATGTASVVRAAGLRGAGQQPQRGPAGPRPAPQAQQQQRRPQVAAAGQGPGQGPASDAGPGAPGGKRRRRRRRRGGRGPGGAPGGSPPAPAGPKP